MKQFKRMAALLSALIICVSALTACGAGFDPDKIDPNGIEDICRVLTDVPSHEVVARVDGEEITAGELVGWIISDCDSQLESYYYYSGSEELPWDTQTMEAGPTLTEFIRQEALGMAAIQHLIRQRAQAEGFALTQEEEDSVQQMLTELEAQVQQTRGTSGEQYLQLHGLTPELYADNIRMDYLYQYICDARFGEQTESAPTDEDVLAWLEETGHYRVKHILLATLDTATREPLSEEEAQKKKQTAEELLEQLNTSEEPEALFDRLMHRYSEDPGLAANPDGYDARTGQMYPEFEEASLALEHGQISGIVESQSGYHIILRLPLTLDPAEHRESFVAARMTQLLEGWLDQAEVETTSAYDRIDARTAHERLTVLRSKAQDELEAGEQADSADGSVSTEEQAVPEGEE